MAQRAPGPHPAPHPAPRLADDRLWAGIDLGTSGIKVALFDEADGVLATAARPLVVSRPHPGWSEQDPHAWWSAVTDAFDELAGKHRDHLGRLGGIGLSGQMLGPVLLDGEGQPLRPAILWNDQRAIEECAALLDAVPDIGMRTNGAPDPGIAAPKLVWLARHEPAIVERARMLVLPKDYVRLRLTGTLASEPTDAGGTMLFDCRSGAWDPELCAAAGWPMAHLPPLLRPWDMAGRLDGSLAARWGAPADVPVAAGAGDNMACALGVGAARPGDVAITLGTSGVVNAVDAAFHPAPDKAVLTSAHAAPGTFLSMGVVMSATASLDWLSRLTGTPAATLAAEAETFAGGPAAAQAPVMRPSLSGIRTPHNRPDTGGIVDGLRHTTDRGALAYAVMEGIAFQIAECVDAQKAAGVRFDNVRLVGGGARSGLWARMVASLLKVPLSVPKGAELAANIGAARLARIAAGAAGPDILSRSLTEVALVAPEPALADRLERRRHAYAQLAMTAAPC